MGTTDSKPVKDLEQAVADTERFYGFHNFGNTCYANSVLQALHNCQPFRVAVLNWGSQRAAQLQLEQGRSRDSITEVIKKAVMSPEIREGDPPLLTTLSFLFEEIQSQKKVIGAIKPYDFISTLRKQNRLFHSPNQQDAHEFLMFLLNDISEALERQNKQLTSKLEHLRRTSSESNHLNESVAADEEDQENSATTEPKSFVQSIFQGILTNETKCLTCESVTSRDEDFLDIQVDIEQNSSITHCLRRFSKVERLTGTNKFRCECCGALQEAEKRTLFKTLPKILVLHLKRFKYLENVGMHTKLSHRVTFPVELRIPSVVPSSSLNTSQSPPLADSIGQIDTTQDDPIYQLSGMVLHLGATAQSGHYVAFIRSGRQWIQMDDHKVSPISDPEILMNRAFGCWNHNPEEPQNSATAYILFYERMS